MNTIADIACLFWGFFELYKAIILLYYVQIYKTTNLQFDETLKSLGNSLPASENLPKPMKSLTTRGNRFLQAGSFPVW